MCVGKFYVEKCIGIVGIEYKEGMIENPLKHHPFKEYKILKSLQSV